MPLRVSKQCAGSIVDWIDMLHSSDITSVVGMRAVLPFAENVFKQVMAQVSVGSTMLHSSGDTSVVIQDSIFKLTVTSFSRRQLHVPCR